ncbi:MAG: Rrf2 family transcriptional regulator [Sedimentisphaerales bacterium]|nr:Rrf2 family transcriptional regulator [Sedimentisphaerales bacterium]
MNISQKCQYALRAVFELAKRQDQSPTKIADIAQTQAIPIRFLEAILSELKHGGFVESRRGVRGGYLLSQSSKDLTPGKIIEFVDGPLSPVNCLEANQSNPCPLQTDCAFKEMWVRAYEAVSEVYNSMTFGELVENYRAARERNITNYSI